MSVKITLLVEGATEKAFLPAVRDFLKIRVPTGGMPKLDIMPYDGRIPTGEKLRDDVFRLLEARIAPSDAVIALTDVYTGTREFAGAAHAKQLMRQWVGEEPRFHPHVALHDFEAWLLPFWHDIQTLAGSNRTMPGWRPEDVNHDNPPAHRLAEIFITGSKGKKYVKLRDAARILRGKDLAVAAQLCPELKAFLNTILILSGGTPLS